MIRNFEDNDLDGVLLVYKSAMNSAPWNEDLSKELLENRFREGQKKINFICRVYQEEASRIVGAMWYEETNMEILINERGSDFVTELESLNLDGRTGWFRDLIVDKDYQSLGIGKKLVLDAIEIWRGLGYKNILLRIHLGGRNNGIPPNTKAIKLYESMGFVLLKTRKLSKDINGNDLNMGFMLLRL